VKVLDSAGDVGGTWYWNRYPGARCDIPTTDYTYSFDPELEKEWTWAEKYATQPEILEYLRFVADHHGLRSDIGVFRHGHLRPLGRAGETVEDHDRRRPGRSGAGTTSWPPAASRCPSHPTSKGPAVSLARSTSPAAGLTRGVDLTGQRVAVIGTGSSGIQSIPLIARQARQLTVFQRTANFSIPARNGPAPADRLTQLG